MTIGPRWIRPEQAAAGILDYVPPDEWPGRRLIGPRRRGDVRGVAGRLVLDRGMGHDPVGWTLPTCSSLRRQGFSGTIEAVHEIEWPVCAVHGGDPMTRDLHGE
jgi:hypothetical protein